MKIPDVTSLEFKEWIEKTPIMEKLASFNEKCAIHENSILAAAALAALALFVDKYGAAILSVIEQID